MEKLLTVAEIFARDCDGEGSGSATSDGGVVVESGVGLPVPDPKALYGVVPALLVAPNMDLFNSLLVSLGSNFSRILMVSASG